MNEIPEELKKKYSMDGKIELVSFYFPTGSNRKHLNYSESFVNSFVEKASKKETMHYPETDAWLYEAIDKYPIKDKNVLIIGSEEPCYEGVAIQYGAEKVTMVEYQRVTTDHPKMITMTVDELSKSEHEYDVAISISSVEHSGLGRYGDLLDPDGDLKAMKDLYNNLKTGGVCFLSVPMGIDQVLWNAHRVYGRHRFPLLIQGFKIIDQFGWVDSDFDVNEWDRRQNGKKPHRDGVSGGAHQPIIVLQKI